MTVDRNDELTAMQRQEGGSRDIGGRGSTGHVGIGARGVGWACIMNGPDSDGGDVGETAARVATATTSLFMITMSNSTHPLAACIVEYE